jgi:hypothetical protein
MGDQLHTPVTHEQLLRAGLTAKQIAGWARPGG